MTENLRLVGARKLTPSDSNISSGYDLPASSTSDWCGEDTELCQNKQNVLDSENTSYGVYYSWAAATAGTGSYSVSSGSASGSVCPKGWRLPTGGSRGEFRALYYNYYNTYELMTDSNGPAFTLAGFRGKNNVSSLGRNGYYWSSTANTSNTAYYLGLIDSAVNPLHASRKYYGKTIHCINE